MIGTQLGGGSTGALNAVALPTGHRSLLLAFVDSSHTTMWHVHASTRASIWAAISRLVVLPVFPTHTTHLWMPAGTAWAKAAHLVHVVAAAVVVIAAALVEWAATPWTHVTLAHALAAIPIAPWTHVSHAHAHAHAPMVTPTLLPLLPAI